MIRERTEYKKQQRKKEIDRKIKESFKKTQPKSVKFADLETKDEIVLSYPKKESQASGANTERHIDRFTEGQGAQRVILDN